MNKNNDWLSKIRPGGTEFGILILPQQYIYTYPYTILYPTPLPTSLPTLLSLLHSPYLPSKRRREERRRERRERERKEPISVYAPDVKRKVKPKFEFFWKKKTFWKNSPQGTSFFGSPRLLVRKVGVIMSGFSGYHSFLIILKLATLNRI
jgi:hypothetical protein